MAVYYRMDDLHDNMNADEGKKKGLYPRVISSRAFLRKLGRVEFVRLPKSSPKRKK